MTGGSGPSSRPLHKLHGADKIRGEFHNLPAGLDVFNGFLLSAQLDALFDSGLITFDDQGLLLPSAKLTTVHRLLLGLTDDPPLRLRWISPQHLPYLAWHRARVFQY